MRQLRIAQQNLWLSCLKILSIGLLSSGLLGGCTSWPPQAGGGFAEHHRQTPLSGEPLDMTRGQLFELELARRHLDVLVLEGAELCFPATVMLAKQRQHRISRELAGGLEADAANDLLIQRDQLARLERQLDYVKAQDLCVLSPPQMAKASVDTLPVEAAARQLPTPRTAQHSEITRLLNSDNQFAVDSAELNPKYVGRLAEAAQQLRALVHIHLRITGHADDVGQAPHNQQLSLARAHQVGRYLQLFGIDTSRLQYAAQASTTPLFDGHQPQIRLVNRRVNIQLLDTTVASHAVNVLTETAVNHMPTVRE